MLYVKPPRAIPLAANEKANKMPDMSDADVEIEIKGQVEEILAIQKTNGTAPKWGVKEHVALIRNLAVGLGLPDDAVKAFTKCLLYKGVGGNSAQFRQIKMLKDVLPKGVSLAEDDLGY